MDAPQKHVTGFATDVSQPFSLGHAIPDPNRRGKAVKIAIIGAGSAQFSIHLVRDLCLTPGLAGSLVCFMDIDAERLASIEKLARRYADEVSADLRFESTLDREQALSGADFVVNTAAQGHADEEHQRSTWGDHGYYRGVYFSYNNLELMLSVARDIERICPDAWLIQSGNPVFEGCTLMTRETGVKVVGLCHGHYGYQKIAKELGLNELDLGYEAPGVNHCIWMTRFTYRGEDAYPLLDRWIEEESAAYWRKPVTSFADTQLSRAAIDLYRTFGLMPIGDTPRFGGYQHVSSWWYHSSLGAKQRWYGELGGFDSEIGWSTYLEFLATKLDEISAIAADTSRPLTESIPPRHSGEQIVPIMDALANDRQGVFQVNVPNRGALQGINDDVVVEVPALVRRDVILPIRTAPLPKRLIVGVLTPKILEMELNLEVFTSNNARTWFHQLMLDHRTRTPGQALSAMQAILDLPFNHVLKERFGDLSEVMSLAGPTED